MVLVVGNSALEATSEQVQNISAVWAWRWASGSDRWRTPGTPKIPAKKHALAQ